jgi:hypothetical protein
MTVLTGRMDVRIINESGVAGAVLRQRIADAVDAELALDGLRRGAGESVDDLQGREVQGRAPRTRRGMN